MSQPPKRVWTKAERALARRKLASAPKLATVKHETGDGTHYANLTRNGRGVSKPASTNVSAVTTAHITGGKRKGKSLKRTPREQASANVTRDMLAAVLLIDPQAIALVNGRGVVKQVNYRR